MTTDHLHPNDPRPEENSSPLSSSFAQPNGAVTDLRSMQTRLADLLDQVSVTSPEVDDEQNISDADGLLRTDSTSMIDDATNEGYRQSQNGEYSSKLATDDPATDELATDDTSMLERSAFLAEPSPVEVYSDRVVDNQKATSDGESSILSFASVETPNTWMRDSATNGESHTLSQPSKPEEKSVGDVRSSEILTDSGVQMMSDDLNTSRSAANTEISVSESEESGNSAITIKGRTDGIAIEIGAGSWRMLMAQLRQKLHQSSGFFRGGAVSLDVGDRSLTDEELATAKEILNEHGLNLNLVRSTSEETSQAASVLSVSVSLEQAEATLAESAGTNHESLEHFVYRGNLRSGQILRRTETILILGDVNPGALVESEGDILVWGRLRGTAHAGSRGDTSAIVSAMLMEPTQLRISDSIAIMPSNEERRSLFGVKKRNPDLAPRPEVAYIAGDSIVVEPWDESKPGGIMAFRRS